MNPRIPQPASQSIKYVVITPARDEGKYIEKTIASVVSQTITPARWVIVDDGSGDNTGETIDAYATRYDWIRAVHRQNRGYRKAGGGVIEAFYSGYSCLDSNDWAFIVKLDGDLSFSENYFERCFEYFGRNPKLGISGGGIYHMIDGKTELEEDHAFHVRGATKIYRKACWEDIGGLFTGPGWDTIDEVKANMLGWETRGLPELTVLHHRFTGGADGAWRNRVKNGFASYVAGYHPLFMIFKCLKGIFAKPYFMASLALFYGFISGYIKKAPQVQDKALIRFIRREQLRKLLMRPSIYSQSRGPR